MSVLSSTDSFPEDSEEDDSTVELTADLLDKADNALLEARRLVPLNEDGFAEFEARHQDVLHPKRSPLIDLLVRSAEWTPDGIMNFCTKLIPKHSKLLRYRNEDDGCTPLHTALSRKNHGFVQAVLVTLGDTGHLPDILEETTRENENCIHLAIRHSSPWTAKMILALASSTKLRNILCQRENDGDRTPLHLVILKAKPPRMPRVVYNSLNNSLVPESSVLDSSLQKKQRHTRMRKKPASEEPIPASHPVFSPEQILRLLIKHGSNDSLLFEDSEGRTPYQQRLQILQNTLLKHYRDASRGNLDEKHILTNNLREFVMKDKIFTALHRPDRGNFRTLAFNSELNLTTLPKTTISKTYLGALSQNSALEPILKSVTLPKLTLEESSTAQAKQAGESMLSSGKRIATSAVFDWLRDQQVRRIIEVDIDDDTEPCCTNDAVEASLKGFEVQRLHWKRTDIPCDVFYNSTSALTDLSLYWSGDKAVLDGWSGPDGFSDARKFPEIRAIALYFRKVPGRQTHILEQLLECKEKLEWSFRNSNREVNIKIYHGWGHNDATDDNPWIATLSRFTSFIGTIPDYIVAPTRIALISDGVDPVSETLRGKIYAIEPGAHVISAKFGTTVASLITQTCPKSSLYIAKAEEGKSGSHNGRHVSPSLAAEAIMSALHHDIDIICIDWSINAGEATGVIDLEEAIATAIYKGILVFCPASASPRSNARSYPADFHRCIRIAAATRYGKTAAPADCYDYVLPGKDIPLFDSGGLLSSHESGDHVAIAIATGLAGILLFCRRLIDSGGFNRLTYIKEAFRGLGLHGENFPLPNTLFEVFQAKALDWKTHEEEMKDMISDLIERVTMRGRV